jgi:hypothetical protein
VAVAAVAKAFVAVGEVAVDLVAQVHDVVAGCEVDVRIVVRVAELNGH